MSSAASDVYKRQGFDLSETGADTWETLWLRGGYPRAYLANSDEDSLTWREGFIRTFLERDIPQLGINIPSTTMRRFWTMLAHYHGQTWNAADIGRSMGLSDKTVRSYLDILTGTFMIRQLQPWFENGMIYFLRNCRNRDKAEEELIRFPRFKRKDIIDAMAQIEHIMFPGKKPETKAALQVEDWLDPALIQGEQTWIGQERVMPESTAIRVAALAFN